MNPFFANVWKGFTNLLFPGLGSLLFNGNGSIFTNAHNNISNAVSQFGELGYDISQNNILGNWIAKMTGSRLTNAEMQANEWNEQQVLSAWNRQMEADNTKYQRQVADMQAAGLNPMLAAGGTLHSPTSAVAQSVSPSAATFGLDSVLDIFKLAAELKNLNADTGKKKAEADKVAAETVGQNIVNKYQEERERLTNEGLGVSNDLNRRQINLISKQIDDIDSQISLRIEQTSNEIEKRSLIAAQALLAKMNAYQVAEMLPYAKALSVAQTQEARSNAAFAAAQAAYQNGLINAGYIDYVICKAAADSRISVSSAEINEIKSAIKNGKNPPDFAPDGPIQALIGAFSNILDAINPLNAILK